MTIEWGSNRLDFGSGVKKHDFCVRDRIDLVLVLGSTVKCFRCGELKLTICGPKLTCFKCDDGLAWFMCGRWWSKLTRFLDAGRKSLGFSVSIEVHMVFVWVEGVDLISVWGIEHDLNSV